jgi:hypothetical protein
MGEKKNELLYFPEKKMIPLTVSAGPKTFLYQVAESQILSYGSGLVKSQGFVWGL